MNKTLSRSGMQFLAWIVLIAIVSLSFAMIPSRRLRFDTEPLHPDSTGNPYAILASMNCWADTIRDHTGKPHANSHLIQVIMDGGNGVQDPPNVDGAPGGDDSMAHGNFNMMHVCGLEDDCNISGRSGLFFSKLYFIPYQPGRAYYLRLWESDSVSTAPYYQDSAEYVAGLERGGAMITLRTGQPYDLDWKFGPSKPRPIPVKKI